MRVFRTREGLWVRIDDDGRVMASPDAIDWAPSALSAADIRIAELEAENAELAAPEVERGGEGT